MSDTVGPMSDPSDPTAFPLPDPERLHELALTVSWRTGRKVGRTIYAQIGSDPSDGDVLIGVMDTAALAAAAVRAHNHDIEATAP